MNVSRTSCAWRGSVWRESASAIGCVREAIKAGGRGRGSIILKTRPAVDGYTFLSVIFTSIGEKEKITSLLISVRLN